MASYRGTPLHAMRFADEVWQPAIARSREEGSSVNAEVAAFLRAYGAGEAFTLEARPKRRRRSKA
jgi:acyl-coenzyme A thioesterase PaaI-like protein